MSRLQGPPFRVPLPIEPIRGFFEAAGVDGTVRLAITSAEATIASFDVAATLSVRAGEPICCAEPSCHIGALRPDGLRELRRFLRELASDAKIELLHVFVTFDIADGVSFLDHGAGMPEHLHKTYFFPAWSGPPVTPRSPRS